ncbi:GAF domain-containing protein, partial [Microcoleus sp. FACHB-831]|uniref:GAF domain-containing sensor histidine kinase n=1 Tax=Microcoleus sp. FACHB-831 TaxID=2692827 RepID=UPI0016878BD5
TAYTAAREYLIASLDSLPGEIWLQHYELAFTLHKELADVEYLKGNFARSEVLIEITLSQAKSALEKAEIYNMLIVQYTLTAKYSEAIQAGLKALSLLGINLPQEDLPAAVMVELAEAKSNLANKEIACLINQDKMKDGDKKIALKLLGNMGPLTFFSSQELWKLTVVKAINLSLKYGFVAEGSYCYSCYGIILSAILGDYKSAFEFGKLAIQLSETSNNLSQNCQDSVIFANYLSCWVKHIKTTNAINSEGYKVGLQSGNLQWTGYNRMFQTMTLFYQGINLEDVLSEISNFMLVCQKTKNQWAADIISANKLAVLSLIGQDDEISEAQHVETFYQHKSMAAICEYHVLKSQILYMYEKPNEALEWAILSLDIINYIMGHISSSHHNFYYSLILTAVYPTASESQQKQYLETLAANQQQMKIWADNCTENFLHKYLLVEAEIARINGRGEGAIDLYDKAIESARENEFIQNEALANELAAKFWLIKGKEDFAQIYMKKAHYGYQLWGALGKVNDLEEKYPQLLSKTPTAAPIKETVNHKVTLKNTNSSFTTTNSAVALDLATVMKASQAISGEILLGGLLNKLIKIVIENAGAQKGFFILNREGKLLIEAAKAVESSEVDVRQSTPADCNSQLPMSVINYVARTHENVVLNNAATEATFATDYYIQLHQPKSVLCAPLINQGKLIGIVYLENNLTTSAFTSDRIEILSILCSQAAISIENALLYDNLQQANEQLEDYSRTLEVKVEERTQELKEKNDQLEQTLQQLRTAQKQIIAQEKLASLGALTAGIAHEIRNPLNFVNNFAAISIDLTQDLEEEIENQSEHLEAEAVEYIKEILSDISQNVAEISRQGQRTQNIVEGMLMHARSDSGQRQLSDVNTILAEAVQLVYHGKRAKDVTFNITLETNYDNTIGLVEVVTQDISRAFINIINNACYAVADKKNVMGENFTPKLAISTLNRINIVEIRIRDNGKGITEEIREKIFHPFFTTKPTGEGTGLGLSLTHDIIVGQHQGQIQLESEIGAFTEFIILLPKKAVSI